MRLNSLFTILRKFYLTLLSTLPLIVSIVWLTTSSSAWAKQSVPSRISFQNLLENKDIALGTVTTVLQDSTGFMWFGGSNGLIRYDGYEFRQMKVLVPGEKPGDPAEEAEIKFIQYLLEDSKGNIWITTRTGIFVHKADIEQTIPVPDDSNQTLKLSTSDLWQTLELPSGEILVSVVGGLIVLKPSDLSYTVIKPNRNDPKGLQGERVTALYMDKENQVWLGTTAGLEKLNWETKEFSLLKPHPEDIKLVSANNVRDIEQDANGNFWIATANGLVYLNTKTGQRTRYINDANDRFSISSNDLWKILLDSKGDLWIASDGGGVSVFDRANKRFINHMFEAGRPGSLNSNQVRTVVEDRSGDIWVGNYPTGINFFDRSSAAITSYARVPSNPKSLSHSSILSVQEDEKGNLWLGSDGGGLNYFDRETGEFTHYKHDPNDANSIGSNAVLTTFIDSKGLVWVGTWGGGAAYLDPKTNKFTRIPYDDQRAKNSPISTSDRLNSAHVWSIREDRSNMIWMTTHTGGVSKYDRNTKQFTHYVHINTDPSSVLNDLIWTTFEDSKGDFWIGTSAGLELMDRDQNTFTHFIADPNDPTSLSNPSVLSAYEDSQGRLWFGTDAGLNMFNRKERNFTHYTKADGFNDDVIRHILEDSTGKLWLSTNNGVSSFDPDTKAIKNYNRESGRLVGGFHTESGVVSSRGEIIFGGVNGLRIYKPAELTENKNIPPVVLTDFKIFADSVVVGGDDGILSKAINHTNSIELDYTKSMFVFGFSALNYRDTGKNQYSYKLEGFDENWLNVGNQRQAKYTNLNAGTYTFKVRGSNNDGVWNEEGSSITIIQYPPPWKTWWAYTLYVLFVIALLAWFIHHQRQKRKLVEEQNRLLEIKVSERTAELAQKNNDIQAMLSNMPQGLFTVLEGGKIHPEYSAYLEKIFDTKDLAGRDVGELLFGNAKLGSDVLDSNNAAVFAIIGEDEMNFDFNSSLLIDEYEVVIGTTGKILSLDWNPILEDDVVVKLMISVRDVTLLRQMENEAKDQKRQLDIISQLLNLSAKKYLGFEDSATNYIAKNRESIELCEEPNEEVVSLLFRNMHTIKGNCRTYGFTHLSNTVHEVESAYSALKNDPNTPWDPESLLDDLDRVEAGIAEYAHVYRTVLGRGDDSSSERHDGLWLTSASMAKIEKYTEEQNFEKLSNYVAKVNSTTIERALVDVIASLSSISSQLGKKTPVVTVEAQGILIRNTILELMNDVFAHILRNSVDHGLESTEERVDADKKEQGSILIKAKPAGKQLHISVEDDGRGLNIKRLFEKGIERGLWTKENHPNNYEIAQTIFKSGISTKEAVTDISGRGVGMDAVKQFLKGKGGNVFLHLHDEKPCKDGFVPFELVVALPEGLFLYDQNGEADEKPVIRAV